MICKLICRNLKRKDGSANKGASFATYVHLEHLVSVMTEYQHYGWQNMIVVWEE